MHHMVECLKHKYEIWMKEWQDESRKRRRLTKRCPDEQHHDRERQPAREVMDHRIGSQQSPSELQDNVRILRRQLTAECTISIVYPATKKLDVSSTPASASSASGNGQIIWHKPTQELPESLEDQEKPSCAVDEEAHRTAEELLMQAAEPADSVVSLAKESEPVESRQMDVILTKENESVEGPGIDLLPPVEKEEEEAPESADATTSRRTPSSASLTAKDKSPAAHGQQSSTARSPPPSPPPALTLPTATNPSSNLVPLQATRAQLGPNVSRLHSWLHSLEPISKAAKRHYEADPGHAEDVAAGGSVKSGK